MLVRGAPFLTSHPAICASCAAPLPRPERRRPAAFAASAASAVALAGARRAERTARCAGQAMSCGASVFIATSLDGFIAKTDGSVDWLNEFSATLPEGEDGGFGEFMASVDGLVMGRKTFESVRDMEGVPWPYGDTPVWVLTRSGVEVPERLKGKVRTTCGTPQEILEQLAKSGCKEVYVDGGETIRDFLGGSS
ncbi:unnamed protein product [Effrenium voratum]|uniref:Bacterial bifunctional deaminase-reductase C-terminal domain-containing protein n=1 Tax=Effrenium voratum TaxID=2562239 RepID=A0AA36IY52_9DINO|nr:unnamed protein product [Effrenium voratum]